MRPPITRTVVWNGKHWVEQETGVFASGMAPPIEEFGQLVEEEHHPIERSFNVTYDGLRKIIREEVDKRTIPEHPPHYFIDGKLLVTHEWLRREVEYRQSCIDGLQEQINQLAQREEQPMDEQPKLKPEPAWLNNFDTREREQIIHARAYAVYHATSGVPGHSQFILIAKLAKLLDEYDSK